MTSHHALATCLAVVALAAALAAPALVQAQSFGVQLHSLLPYSAPGGTAASIYTRAGDCRLVVCAEALSFETGFLANVATVSASGSVAHSGGEGAQFGEASATALANANIGALAGAASARASSTNAAAGSTAFIYTAWVGFNINTRDDIVLRSSTLANGAPVDVRFTLTLDSTVTQRGAFPGSVGGAWASLVFDTEGGPSPGLRVQDTTQSGPPSARLVSTVLHLQVGQTYTLLQSLDISALGNLAWNGLSGPQSWALDVSADHTSLALVDVLGDATLLAASGHNYASAVPEPATAAMFLAGLLGSGFLARRRLPR